MAIVIILGFSVGPKWRPFAGITLWFSFALSVIVLGIIAIFVQTWKILMIVITAHFDDILLHFSFSYFVTFLFYCILQLAEYFALIDLHSNRPSNSFPIDACMISSLLRAVKSLIWALRNNEILPLDFELKIWKHFETNDPVSWNQNGLLKI